MQAHRTIGLTNGAPGTFSMQYWTPAAFSMARTGSISLGAPFWPGARIRV